MNIKGATGQEVSCRITHIPDKPPIPPHLQPTVDVYAADIQPKQANTLIRKLNQIAPLENLCHVKRVRKKYLDGGTLRLSIILCMTFEEDSRFEKLPSDVMELVNTFQFPNMLQQQKKIGLNNANCGQLLIIHPHIISMA